MFINLIISNDVFSVSLFQFQRERESGKEEFEALVESFLSWQGEQCESALSTMFVKNMPNDAENIVAVIGLVRCSWSSEGIEGTEGSPFENCPDTISLTNNAGTPFGWQEEFEESHFGDGHLKLIFEALFVSLTKVTVWHYVPLTVMKSDLSKALIERELFGESYGDSTMSHLELQDLTSSLCKQFGLKMFLKRRQQIGRYPPILFQIFKIFKIWDFIETVWQFA